jgi:hypothetical protein
MIKQTREDLQALHSHAAPSTLVDCLSMDDLFSEVQRAAAGKWDTVLSAAEIVLDGELRLPDGIPLTETAIKSACRLGGIPSTVATWCNEGGYSTHVGEYINNSFSKIAYQDAETGRPPSRYFARFRKDSTGKTVCRALFSGSYGLLDNLNAVDILGDAIKGALFRDVVVRRFSHDGDSLSVSLLLPDYVITLPDSDYGCGIEVTNSEVDGPFTVGGFTYRAQCKNGMLLGVSEGLGFKRRHSGRIDLDNIKATTRIAVHTAIEGGRKSLLAQERAWKIKIADPRRLIAYLCKQGRLNREHARQWMQGYEETIQEPRSPAGTVGALLNGLTRAARTSLLPERRLLEGEAGRLLAPGIALDLSRMDARWRDWEVRAQELKDYEIDA